jgi:hypothetical protein
VRKLRARGPVLAGVCPCRAWLRAGVLLRLELLGLELPELELFELASRCPDDLLAVVKGDHHGHCEVPERDDARPERDRVWEDPARCPRLDTLPSLGLDMPISQALSLTRGGPAPTGKGPPSGPRVLM